MYVYIYVYTSKPLYAERTYTHTHTGKVYYKTKRPEYIYNTLYPACVFCGPGPGPPARLIPTLDPPREPFMNGLDSDWCGPP
jgi:hypothetical protein